MLQRCHPSFVHRRLAFTLVELLVVIAIIGLLMAILLPALGKARLRAQQIQCAANLRQFGIGHLTYADGHKGWFPRGLHASLASIQFDNTSQNRVTYVEQYYGPRVDEWMLCPSYSNQAVTLPQYSPGNGGTGLMYGLGLLTTYRIYTGRGTLMVPTVTANTNYFAWGYYALGNTAVYNSMGMDQPFVVPTPNINFAGTWIENPTGALSGGNPATRLHIKQPGRQPMAFDARNQSAPGAKWYAYAAATTFQNMHVELGGTNVVFLDGHTRWTQQDNVTYPSNTIRANQVGYWQGLHYFLP